MKSVTYGIAAMLIISAVAWIALDFSATGSDEQFTSNNNSVRLD